MSWRPAVITQADVARIIRAAKQAGADRVSIPVNGQAVIVHLSPSTAPDEPTEPKRESIL